MAERVARETADFLIADLLTAQGGFASALDADTDGVEGLTFTWAPGEGAPEAGIKLFLTDSTFLFGMAQYQFFFNNNSTTFSHGQFLYNVGLGLRF